jgi:hypothetical protein
MMTTSRNHLIIRTPFIAFIIIIFLAGCNISDFLSPGNAPTPAYPIPATPTALPSTQITFTVETPADTIISELTINLLDEVTGLALNPARYPMQKIDARHFTVKIPVTLGSIIKYRYSRSTPTPMDEYNGNGYPVRYRMYYATNPATINDYIYSWQDNPHSAPTGQIQGVIIDKVSGAPIPDILVSIAGNQVFTNSDGSYRVNGIPEGTHNFVAYAIDGAYQTFQQGARIAVNSTTTADITLTPSPLVNVTFNMYSPELKSYPYPVRLAGNLFQFGNTFSDLAGGVSTIASRMPSLKNLGNGNFSYETTLPVGTYLKYKYTLGDGFWNSEQTINGKFSIREIIIPGKDIILQDHVYAWRSGNSAPVIFQVNTPANTSASDQVSIQFNPFAWTEPIPIWSQGNNQWAYTLFGPLQTLGGIGYRYCRNDQCGYADDNATRGKNSKGYPLSSSLFEQTIQDDVASWAWSQSSTSTEISLEENIIPRGNSFIAGVEFIPAYHPSWLKYYPTAIQDINQLGANRIIITPTWSYRENQNPVLTHQPGKNPMWADLLNIYQAANSAGYTTLTFPNPTFPASSGEFWIKTNQNASWWQTWFENYRVFLINFADLAQKTNSEALILGGDWVSPALPSGLLQDGTSSGVSDDADARWTEIIKEARAHFTGQIIFALPLPPEGQIPPSFLSNVDKIYLIMSPDFSDRSSFSNTDLDTRISETFDKIIYPYHTLLNKPVIIGASFPSAGDVAEGCIISPQGYCLNSNAFDYPNSDIPNIRVNLNGQAIIYNALLKAINQRDWINGFITRGYYPPVELLDKSTSIRGKPAAKLLGYYFPRIMASTQ